MKTGMSAINPVQSGHTLVVPREEVDHWVDLEPTLAAHLMAVAQTVGRAQQAVYEPLRVGLLIAGLELERVRRAARDDDVVLLAERHASEDGAQDAAPAVDVEDLASSICDLRLASAGSLIGNFTEPLPFVTTFDISAEYSVEMWSSEKWIISRMPKTSS